MNYVNNYELIKVALGYYVRLRELESPCSLIAFNFIGIHSFSGSSAIPNIYLFAIVDFPSIPLIIDRIFFRKVITTNLVQLLRFDFTSTQRT